MFVLKEARLGKKLGLRTPMNTKLTCNDVQVNWNGKDRKIRTFDLTFWVSWEDWLAAVDPNALFHLTAEKRGPIMGGSLVEELPVWIEARLHPSHHALVGHDGVQDILDAAGEILDSDKKGPLRFSESWYALNASQEVMPGLKLGFSTDWAEKGAIKGA